MTHPFPVKPGSPIKPDFTLTEVCLDGEGPDWLNLEWATKSAGAGMTTFSEEPDGSIFCDNEAMGKAFVRSVLATFLEGKSQSEWPDIMASYDSIDAFLDACKTRHPWK